MTVCLGVGGLDGGLGTVSGVGLFSGMGIVASEASVVNGVELSPSLGPDGPARNDDEPRADLGRGLEDARLGCDELLIRLPPRDDDVDPARSRDEDEVEGLGV